MKIKQLLIHKMRQWCGYYELEQDSKKSSKWLQNEVAERDKRVSDLLKEIYQQIPYIAVVHEKPRALKLMHAIEQMLEELRPKGFIEIMESTLHAAFANERWKEVWATLPEDPPPETTGVVK